MYLSIISEYSFALIALQSLTLPLILLPKTQFVLLSMTKELQIGKLDIAFPEMALKTSLL